MLTRMRVDPLSDITNAITEAYLGFVLFPLRFELRLQLPNLASVVFLPPLQLPNEPVATHSISITHSYRCDYDTDLHSNNSKATADVKYLNDLFFNGSLRVTIYVAPIFHISEKINTPHTF